MIRLVLSLSSRPSGSSMAGQAPAIAVAEFFAGGRLCEIGMKGKN